MAIQDPPPRAETADVPNRREPFGRRINPKKWLNHYAAKALQSADVVLGSIPIAEVAAEIKDVALIAITD